MNKLTKEKRDKLLLVCIATAFATLGIFYFVISPQREQISLCEEKSARALDAIDKDEKWMRQAATVREKLDAQRKEIEAVETEMAPLDKLKWFLAILESVRVRHNVSLVDVTAQPELGEVGVLPAFPYKAATFGVKFSATYHDFGAFLADFENRFPHMRVQNLRMEGDAGRKPAAGSAGNSSGAAEGEGVERLAMTFKVVTLIKPTKPI